MMHQPFEARRKIMQRQKLKRALKTSKAIEKPPPVSYFIDI